MSLSLIGISPSLNLFRNVHFSGWLPKTGDIDGLPDPDLFPSSPPSEADAKAERDDRVLLQRSPAQQAELRAVLKAIDERSSRARIRFDAASKLAAEAEAAFLSARAEQARAKEAALKGHQDVIAAEEAKVATTAALALAIDQLKAAKSALEQAEKDALAEVAETQGPAGRPMEKLRLAAAKEVAVAAKRLESASAAEQLANDALPIKRLALGLAQDALVAASTAFESSERMAQEARQAHELATAEAASESAAVSEARSVAEASLMQLERESAEAVGRVTALVTERQLQDLRQWIYLEGPDQPLNIKW